MDELILQGKYHKGRFLAEKKSKRFHEHKQSPDKYWWEGQGIIKDRGDNLTKGLRFLLKTGEGNFDHSLEDALLRFDVDAKGKTWESGQSIYFIENRKAVVDLVLGKMHTQIYIEYKEKDPMDESISYIIPTISSPILNTAELVREGFVNKAILNY